MKTIFIATLLTISSISSVNAKTVKICRPNVANPVQILAQFLQYPKVPMCSEKGQGTYQVHKKSFLREDRVYKDSSNNFYMHDLNSGSSDRRTIKRVRFVN